MEERRLSIACVKILFAAFACLVLMGSPARAAVIFMDDFNRSNNVVGNGWHDEIENDANDVKVNGSELVLKDQAGGTGPDAAVTQTVDTSAYVDIEISYRWKRLNSNSEPADKLFVGWKEASATDWIVLGMLICSVVGVIFGTYPAWRAANLDPVESLRYE